MNVQTDMGLCQMSKAPICSYTNYNIYQVQHKMGFFFGHMLAMESAYEGLRQFFFLFFFQLKSRYRIRPNYRTVRLGFSKLLGTLRCDKICTYTY